MPAVQCYIAYRDLLFGNLLWTTETNSISGVLDWELAGVSPLSDWNPGNTCWTVIRPKISDGASQETFMQMLDEEREKRNAQVVEDLQKKESISMERL